MPEKDKIVEAHREDLTRRLLSRNPLLNFRPSRKTRIDICDMFPESTTDATTVVRDSAWEEIEALLASTRKEEKEIKKPRKRAMEVKSDNHVQKQNILKEPEMFLEDLLVGKECKVEPPSDFLAPLRRLQKNATDSYRTNGHWPLCFGWPLVHIPIPQKQKNYCVPLLFWKIKISIQGNDATFSLYEEGMEFNFMLKAYLERENNLQLDWQCPADTSLTSLREEIINTLANWDKCETGDFQTSVESYEELEDIDCPHVKPCAVIGSAAFHYRTVLEELSKITEKINKGEKISPLLDKMLTGANTSVKFPIADEPVAAHRYLLEESDPTQESAIWQARQEQLRLMLIKGPPGTGKSQTIVNLIADAVKSGKKVALVCQKKAALDVVRKRIDGVGLGGIVVQVNSPSLDRINLIKKAKNEKDKIDRSSRYYPILQNSKPNREELSRDIDFNEKQCEKSLKNQGSPHSIRGDLRAKIDRVGKEHNFQAFSQENKKLLKDFKECFGQSMDKTISQQKADELIQETKKFTDDWKSCGYKTNPWRKIPKEWDRKKMTELSEQFDELNKISSHVHLKIQNLISKKSLVLASHPITNPHFHSFFNQDQREVVKDFCDLIVKTRSAFQTAEIREKPLWKQLLYKNCKNPYEHYKNEIRHDNFGKIQDINQKLEQESFLQLLKRKFPDSVSSWPDLLLSVICKLRFDRMPFDLEEYNKSMKELKKLYPNKKELDKEKVLMSFSNRKGHIESLESRNLLRQRGGGGIPSTSLRRLYHQGNELIWKVFPVLLTNPDALCQIVPCERELIDLIIIDEASQMFTADALPLFYRAKKVVIAGDDMQMPPSDLFTVSREIDDSNSDDDDDESTQLPETGSAPADGRYELLQTVEHFLLSCENTAYNLEVHYRSRPSELIAFSNHAFYKGNLQAAPDNSPMPNYMNRPIEVKQVEGKFQNGINQEECKAVVDKLRHIWKKKNPPSAGVIVFNVKQERQLKAMIDDECQKDTDFREKYDRACQQTDDGEDIGFFVRSVENVQGDERDIIILATTYDNERRNLGIISQKEKGRRRLNVAVTRAKLGMFVITSLDIDRISNMGKRPDEDDPREGSENWFLWMYMRYARAVSKGNSETVRGILQEVNPEYNPHPTGQAPDSEFEIQVADFLREKGYYVDYQVGEGGFRIDLGVKLKKDDSRYLCGVECDGRIWHSGWRKVLDDICRQKILESKGWKIVRIWSDNWFDSPKVAKEGLLKDIGKLVKH